MKKKFCWKCISVTAAFLVFLVLLARFFPSQDAEEVTDTKHTVSSSSPAASEPSAEPDSSPEQKEEDLYGLRHIADSTTIDLVVLNPKLGRVGLDETSFVLPRGEAKRINLIPAGDSVEWSAMVQVDDKPAVSAYSVPWMALYGDVLEIEGGFASYVKIEIDGSLSE